MDLVDSKFIGLISPRLQKFKRVKSDLYNFRCPICGDSQKNKSKTRGYLYSVKADINFRCHNCGASMTLSNFLKTLDPAVHKQYVFERFKSNTSGRGTVVEEPKFNFEAPKFAPKVDLPRASEVPAAKKYLEKRKLDPSKFYYTDAFKRWVNTFVDKFENIEYDEARIIIPLIYKNQLIGFQGRALGPNSVKYITIMLNDDAPKIYGLDKIRDGIQSSLRKARSTQRSFAIVLHSAVQTVMLGSGVLAVVFGFMITSRGAMRLLNESQTPSAEVRRL